MVNNKKILITIASAVGSTEKLAQMITEGIRKVDGISLEVKRARDVKPDDAVLANGYAFGSYSASEYMEGEFKKFFEELYPLKGKLSGKPVLLFTTGLGSQVSALASMEKLVGVFNPQWIKPGLAVKGMPGQADKANAIEMGEKLADAVKNKNPHILSHNRNTLAPLTEIVKITVQLENLSNIFCNRKLGLHSITSGSRFWP